VLSGADLFDFDETTATGAFTFGWNSAGFTLDPGTWVCALARDIRHDHGPNANDVGTVGNRKAGVACYQVPQGERPPPATGLTVVKTNDAHVDNVFQDDEIAATPQQDVNFKLLITNNSDVSITVDDVTDAWPGHAADTIADLACESTIQVAGIFNAASLGVGFTIPAGGSVTCTFTKTGYSPNAGGSVTNTAEVSATADDDSDTSLTAHDTSVVRTPPAGGCQSNCGGGCTANCATAGCVSNCGSTPPPPTDLCTESAGLDTTVPIGWTRNSDGTCTPPQGEVLGEVLALTPEVPQAAIADPAVEAEVVATAEPVLAFTGSSTTGLLEVAAGLMIAGLTMVLAGRRRRSTI
jgi:hypothetical protein